MKNLVSKNIIFLSNKKIALVVLNNIFGKNNILFSNEVEVDEGNIQAKLSDMLTNAANFLGFNIKSADLVFEDFDISVKLINKKFTYCSSKEEVIKQIYKDARINKNFVNNVVFGNDKLDFSKNIICKTLVSKYDNYANFKGMLKHSNVKVDNCLNIATLLNNNAEEAIISIRDNQAFAYQYINNNLSNCINLNINFDAIVEKLAVKFAVSKETIKQASGIANILAKNENQDLDLAWNYSLKDKTLTCVNGADFIKSWREELVAQIKTNLMINNWANTIVLTEDELNNFNNTNIEHELVAADALSDEIVLAINNVDRIGQIENHSKYDAKVESEYERIVA